MLADEYAAAMKFAFDRTTYGGWLRDEGVAVVEDFSVEDVRALELAPWPRLGGKAAFINLYPMLEAARGMYVAEIAPGGSLEPERHLYEKVVCILEGRGATEIWQEGDSSKHVFEWGRGSVFAPPLNTWHRLFNLGQEPVKFLAVTTAPAMMNGFRNPEFIFHCPYTFRERYNGEETYFTFSQKEKPRERGRITVWETNLIHNALEAELDDLERKAHGSQLTSFEMSGNHLMGHISEWPVGRYHKAHYHGPGALLMGLRSEGYVLIWPKELGTHPYEKGYGDEVVQRPWRRGSLYSPPTDWFHQHFNTGKEPARHIAIRTGSDRAGPGFGPLDPLRARGIHATLVSMKEGGTLLDYEHEDPEVRKRYQEALRRNAVPCAMPEAIYQAGASKIFDDEVGD